MFGLPFDDQELINDARYIHYCRIRNRIILKDDILHRQYYNEVGDTSHLQIFLPLSLLAIVPKSLHGTASKHFVISQMMQEIQRKNYIPSTEKYVQNWVQQCET